MKKRMLSLILILVMSLSMLSACGQEENEQVEMVESSLVVGYTSFDEVFTPFYARTSADKDVVAMTQVNLLTLDREGSVIYNAIKGETRDYKGTDYTYYGIADIDVKQQNNGTIVYDITLRDDVKFSDGEVLNAEDLIFTMYVLCDPLYDGPYNLGQAPIVGLKEYKASMRTLFDALVSAGIDNTDYTFWDQATQENFWKELEIAGAQFAQNIVDYLEESSGTTSIAQAAKLWGYEGLSDDASTTEFFYLMCEAHNWDLNALNEAEAVGKTLFSLMENYDAYTKGIQLDKNVEYIAGIEMTGEYSVRVVMSNQNVANIHYLNIPVVPMHYYGNPSLFQYESNVFGFVKGDLSLLHESAQYPNKNALPMGAGPYVFVPAEEESEEESTMHIVFQPNEHYYRGKALTDEVQFIVISTAKKISGIVNNKIDLTDVSMTKKVGKNIADTNQKVRDEAIANAESSGEIIDPTTIADAVSSEAFDVSSYGYIGINANLVNVNGDADSKASVALRKAFATMFSAYREEFVNLYYGGNASVVDYPVSNASWAAPDKTAKGYQTAYAQGIDGKAIYTENMSLEEKYVAAKNAALEYFKVAGYVVENGVVISAPHGATMEFEVIITGNSLGEHPAYMTLLHSKAALAELGINLVIKDVTDEDEMWKSLENGTCQMWAAAWDVSAEPDIYEMYHNEGAYNYMYGIDDDALSANLEKLRTTPKQSSREKLYKNCYDIVLDWAVEVPVYQKQNGIIYSSDRILSNTLTQDMTVYYGWMSEVHNIQMNMIDVEIE